MKKVINGYWDGEPIWRWQTAGEQLVEAMEENKRAEQIKLSDQLKSKMWEKIQKGIQKKQEDRIARLRQIK